MTFPLLHYASGFFFIHPMETVASMQNRSRNYNGAAPSMKNFLCIIRIMEMVPSIKSNETFFDRGRDQQLWQLVA